MSSPGTYNLHSKKSQYFKTRKGLALNHKLHLFGQERDPFIPLKKTRLRRIRPKKDDLSL